MKEYKCAPVSLSLPDGIRLESEALHGLAVDELDLFPWNHVALPVLAFAVAYLAAFCRLFEFAALRAFACDL